MEKRLEQRGQREAEPGVEPLFAKISSVMRQLLNRCEFIVYQVYGDVVRDAKVFPKLLFKQKINKAL